MLLRGGSYNNTGISGLVLAGGPDKKWLGHHVARLVFGLLEQELWVIVLRALAEGGCNDIIVVAAWVEKERSWSIGTSDGRLVNCRVVPQAGSFGANVKLGLGLAACQKVLIATADLPWLSGQTVAKFIQLANKGDDKKIVCPIARVGELGGIAGYKPTGAKVLWEGECTAVTNANLFIVDKGLAPAKLDSFFAARKNPVLLAGLLGWKAIFEFITAQRRGIDLEVIKRAVVKAMGIDISEIGVVMLTGSAALEACFDIDKPSRKEAMDKRPSVPTSV
jgi:CTP:molybdopterin cytidylyltransferase MocA